MSRTRTVIALLLMQLLALGAVAQSAEFGRAASTNTIKAITKSRRPLSGSLSLTRSARGDGYDGTLGGTLLDDRLWVFAAASVFPSANFSNTDFKAIDATATAQPVDWTSATASFRQLQRSAFDSVPSSFLSLRSTTILSDHATFDFSVSQSRP
jgi:hypothetical protein